MGQYKIEYKQEGGSGGLYELEQKHFYYLTEAATGNILRTFEGVYYANYNGVDWTDGYFEGVTKVELAPDEAHLVVWTAGMTAPEIIPL